MPENGRVAPKVQSPKEATRAQLPTPESMGLIVRASKNFVERVRRFVTIEGSNTSVSELPRPLKLNADIQVFVHAQILHAGLKPEFPDEPRYLTMTVHEERTSTPIAVPLFGPGRLIGIGVALGAGMGYRGWDPEVLIGLEWLSTVFYDVVSRWGWIEASDVDTHLVMKSSGAGSIAAQELCSLERAISALPPEEELPNTLTFDDALARSGGSIQDWLAPEMVGSSSWRLLMCRELFESERVRSYLRRFLPHLSFELKTEPTNCEPSQPDERGPSNGRKRSGKTSRQKAAERAMAVSLRIEHPDWEDKAIALAVGCHPKSIYRWPEYLRASELAAIEADARKREMARGAQDRESGQVEAWRPGDHPR